MSQLKNIFTLHWSDVDKVINQTSLSLAIRILSVKQMIQCTFQISTIMCLKFHVKYLKVWGIGIWWILTSNTIIMSMNHADNPITYVITNVKYALLYHRISCTLRIIRTRITTIINGQCMIGTKTLTNRKTWTKKSRRKDIVRLDTI